MEAVVLEAEDFGSGASTRNAGGVGGAINVGKSLGGRRLKDLEDEREGIIAEAAQAFGAIESLIAREGIDCDWQLNGRFVGAWTPEHYRAQQASLALLNEHAGLDAQMVPRERQREEIGTDLYHGGMAIARSGSVNPALLYKGLFDRAILEGGRLCGQARVIAVERDGTGWKVTTERGALRADHVVVAANGYIDKAAPRLRRRILPVLSNIIVTEELPEGLAEQLLPTNRYVNDSLRIRSYYRLTPDRRRILFGGRGRFSRGTYDQHATALYRMMIERLPGLKGTRITHAWSGQIAFTLDSIPHVGAQDGLHFALGCNGSGIAMMTYLGDYIGRKVAGTADITSRFERPLPGHALYGGDPWFLPIVGRYFQFLDRRDRRRQSTTA